MFKTINAVNSLLGTIVSLALLAVLGTGGWFGLRWYLAKQDMESRLAAQEKDLKERDAKIAEMGKDLQAKLREITRLSTANRLLKVDHRVAQLDVVSQEGDAKAGTLVTRFNFVEVDDRGQPMEKPRELSVKGDTLHVDALIVKFEDKSVEEGDPLRSTSLCLFQRIYGDKQKPEEAFRVDAVGAQPVAYRNGKESSDLEREIWANFWDLANDPGKAAKMGVRSAGGEGIWHKVLPGKRYKLTLRASGGLSVVPEELPPVPGGPTL